MALYYNTMNLTDVEVRLRYLTAYHIEDSFRSLFPNITSHVFGSSVNGFGKRGCDLDVRITLDNVIKVRSFSIACIYNVILILVY